MIYHTEATLCSHRWVIKMESEPIRVILVLQEGEVIAYYQELVGSLSVEVIDLVSFLIVPGCVHHEVDTLRFYVGNPCVGVLLFLLLTL